MDLSTLKQPQTIIVIGLVILLLTGIATAAYLMTAPDSAPVTVNPTPTPSPTPSPTPIPQATLSQVQTNVTSMYVGDKLRLTTTVSDGTAGLIVNFYEKSGAAVGSATTNATGTATLTITPAVGSWVYYATATHS
jgi:hypothetical protein